MPLGTHIYLLGLNLAASEHQATLMQLLKSRGDDVIQTSSGLCVKTSMAQSELESFLKENATDGIKVETIDAATDRAKLAPDVQAFIN